MVPHPESEIMDTCLMISSAISCVSHNHFLTSGSLEQKIVPEHRRPPEGGQMPAERLNRRPKNLGGFRRPRVPQREVVKAPSVGVARAKTKWPTQALGTNH